MIRDNYSLNKNHQTKGERKMKWIATIIMLACVTIAIIYINNDNKANTAKVYAILEQEELSREDADYVLLMTDPDEMKEGFVSLDQEHRAMFKKHFGHER